MVAQKSSSIAASSGVKCATVFVAASTLFSNEATVAEESAARPRLLPASARKSRRVRSRTMKLEIATKWEQRDEELAADLFSVGYPAVSQERALERASVQRTLVFCTAWSARPKISILSISRRRPKFRPNRTGRIVFRGVTELRLRPIDLPGAIVPPELASLRWRNRAFAGLEIENASGRSAQVCNRSAQPRRRCAVDHPPWPFHQRPRPDLLLRRPYRQSDFNLALFYHVHDRARIAL